MTNNEKLIEEAAKAIRDVRFNHTLPHAHRGGSMWTDSDLARAALAVFEKAHTPTDDEREALADDAGFRPSEVPEPRLLTGVELDALFAEPQPEPSSQAPEPSAERELTPCENLVCTGCRVCGCPALGIEPQGDSDISVERMSAQGEPSSEVPEPSAQPTCEHGTPLSELCDYAARYASGETDGPHPEHAQPQGEPSDAQVDAAIAAFHRHAGDYIERSSASWQRERMRGALRAAGVRGGGAMNLTPPSAEEESYAADRETPRLMA